MSRASNSLLASDVTATPIKLKYTASYDSSSLNAYGITVWTGVNGPVTYSGSVPQQTLNYRSIRQLFYSNYLTGSTPVSASSFDDSLQSTAAYGTVDADYRSFPTQSGGTIKILSIPTGVFGVKISRFGFTLTSSLYEIVDDSNGNVKDVRPTTPVHVGNIIYQQGFVVITNPDYLDIFEYVAPTTTTTSTTTSTTTVPTTTSTTTSTTTVPTTTSTTTSTTTVPTTTSTTTSTTTEPTTTTSTTTSTTTVPTTTTSTTTSTTTEPTTTTTSTTTTTTTVPPGTYYEVQLCSGGSTYIMNATDITPVVGGVYKVYAPTYLGTMDGINCWTVVSTQTSGLDDNALFGTNYGSCETCNSTTTTSTTTSTTTEPTTTTTSTTTTTTTISCGNWNVQAFPGGDTTIQYYDCSNVLHTVTLGSEEFLGCTAVNNNGFGTDIRFQTVSGLGWGSESPC